MSTEHSFCYNCAGGETESTTNYCPLISEHCLAPVLRADSVFCSKETQHYEKELKQWKDTQDMITSVFVDNKTLMQQNMQKRPRAPAALPRPKGVWKQWWPSLLKLTVCCSNANTSRAELAPRARREKEGTR